MRTIRRLITAMAIMIPAAGAAASCVLPPYDTGEQSSGSGSGGKAASSSSGHGGDSSVASSSTASSSSKSSSADTSSSGTTCMPWIPCDAAAIKGKPCPCADQRCSDPQCGNGGLVLVCEANFWKQAAETCCPTSPPCDPAMDKLCLTIADPNKPGAHKGQCVTDPCGPQMPPDCTCAKSVCMAPLTICSSPAPNTILCSQ